MCEKIILVWLEVAAVGVEEQGLILNVSQKRTFFLFLKSRGGMRQQIWLSVVWLFPARGHLDHDVPFWRRGSHRSVEE